MKNLIAVTIAALFALSLGGEACADEYAPEEKAPTEAQKPSVKKEQTVEATATVEAVDLDKRLVTLKDPDGHVFHVMVGEQVRNLPQVKVGDLVKVKYYESVAVQVMKPGEAPGGTQAAVTGERAKPGEKPGGVIAGQVTVTATVVAIDAKKQHVALKGPEGNIVDVKVQDPKNLENVQVGDEVVITYTEALAISVEKAKK